MTTFAATLFASLALLLVGGAWPRLREALSDQSHPDAPRRLLAALRRLIVGVGLGVVAAGAWSGQSWLLAFGLVFLVEEILECSVHLAILRAGSSRADGTSVHAWGRVGR